MLFKKFLKWKKTCDQSNISKAMPVEKLTIPKSFGELEVYASKVALWFEKYWNMNKRYEVISENEDYYVEEGIIYQRSPKKLMLVLPITCEEFTFPQNLGAIACDALKFCNIKRVILPESFTGELPNLGGQFEEIVVCGAISAVGIAAFSDNKKLRSVILPDFKIRIGEGAFSGCTNLTELVLPSFHNLDIVETECMKTMPAYNKAKPFKDCVHLCKLRSGSIIEEWNAETATLIISGSGVFYGSVFGRDFYVSPKKLVFRGQITKIHALLGHVDAHGSRRYRRGCEDRLNSLAIEEGIEEIGSFAFAGCQNLEKVSFPQSLKAIGEKAFWDCTALSVPDISRISVGPQAFWGCVNAPDTDADYENTIFCGQKYIFAFGNEQNYRSDYKKAIDLLSAFCRHSIHKHDAQIHQKKNCMFAEWSASGFHHHDGYEYSRGASIVINRISKDEYDTAAKTAEQAISQHGYLGSAYQSLQKHSSECFIWKVNEDPDSCEMIFFCNCLLRIAGYFKICQKHWDTM